MHAGFCRSHCGLLSTLGVILGWLTSARVMVVDYKIILGCRISAGFTPSKPHYAILVRSQYCRASYIVVIVGQATVRTCAAGARVEKYSTVLITR